MDMETQYGFLWGPVRVERLIKGRAHGREYWLLQVNDLQIVVTPTGKTRVFRQRKARRGKELK